MDVKSRAQQRRAEHPGEPRPDDVEQARARTDLGDEHDGRRRRRTNASAGLDRRQWPVGFPAAASRSPTATSHEAARRRRRPGPSSASAPRRQCSRPPRARGRTATRLGSMPNDRREQNHQQAQQQRGPPARRRAGRAAGHHHQQAGHDLVDGADHSRRWSTSRQASGARGSPRTIFLDGGRLTARPVRDRRPRRTGQAVAMTSSATPAARAPGPAPRHGVVGDGALDGLLAPAGRAAAGTTGSARARSTSPAAGRASEQASGAAREAYSRIYGSSCPARSGPPSGVVSTGRALVSRRHRPTRRARFVTGAPPRPLHPPCPSGARGRRTIAGFRSES